jgi:hypothetical protein
MPAHVYMEKQILGSATKRQRRASHLATIKQKIRLGTSLPLLLVKECSVPKMIVGGVRGYKYEGRALTQERISQPPRHDTH